MISLYNHPLETVKRTKHRANLHAKHWLWKTKVWRVLQHCSCSCGCCDGWCSSFIMEFVGGCKRKSGVHKKWGPRGGHLRDVRGKANWTNLYFDQDILKSPPPSIKFNKSARALLWGIWYAAWPELEIVLKYNQALMDFRQDLRYCCLNVEQPWWMNWIIHTLEERKHQCNQKPGNILRSISNFWRYSNTSIRSTNMEVKRIFEKDKLF